MFSSGLPSIMRSSINLEHDTRERLKAYKRGGESYDRLLRRIMAEYDPAEDVAQGALDGQDIAEASRAGLSAEEYIREEYGLEASRYDSAADLHDDVRETLRGE